MSGIIEYRLIDDLALTGNQTRTVYLDNAKTLISILQVRAKTGTPTTMSLIVTIFRLDPGTKKKLGTAIITHTTVTEVTALPFLEDKVFQEPNVATVLINAAGGDTNPRLLGLCRVEIALSFTGGTSPSAVVKYTIVGKE